MGDNLRRYAYWQLRDFIRERAIALMLIGLLLGFVMVAPMRAVMQGNIDPLNTRRILLIALPQVAFIASFVIFNGIISTDRKMGYYRFLFSKPVSIPAFYAQSFVVNFVGFMAVFAILLGVYAFAMTPINPFGALAYCALVYLSLGGIAFFISSLWRHDWPILAAVYLAASLAHSLWGDRDGWRMVIRNMMPPLHKLNPALGDLVNLGTIDLGALAWLLGYSALFFVAGLVVLWRRPIG